jgi:AraC-like DNA-binding protein
MVTYDKNFIDCIPDLFTNKEAPMCFSFTDIGDNTYSHTHQFIEIFYIVSGNITHQLQGQKAQTISEGDIFLILPPTWHRYERNTDEYCAHRDIIIRADYFKEACQFLSPDLYQKFLSQQIPTHTRVSSSKLQRLEKQINYILQMPSILSDNKQMLLRSLIIQLLQCFISSDAEELVNRVPAWFRRLLSNFEKIEYLQLGLPKIMEEFNYDNKYLCHVFKRYMGITMTEHLNNARLVHALHMLQNTDRSVLDISSYLGFSSVSYFSTVFKNKYGIPPSAVRKNTSTASE